MKMSLPRWTVIGLICWCSVGLARAQTGHSPEKEQQESETSTPAVPPEQWYSTIKGRLYYEIHQAGIRVGRMEVMIEHIERDLSGDARCVRFSHYLFPTDPDLHDQYQQIRVRCYAERPDGTPLKTWGKHWDSGRRLNWEYDLQDGAHKLSRTKLDQVDLPPPQGLRFMESLYQDLLAVGDRKGYERTHQVLDWRTGQGRFQEVVYVVEGPEKLTLDGTEHPAHKYHLHPAGRPFEVSYLWLDEQGWPLRIYAPYDRNRDIRRCSKATYDTGLELTSLTDAHLALPVKGKIDDVSRLPRARYLIRAPDLRYVSLAACFGQTWRRVGEDAYELEIDLAGAAVGATPDALRSYLEHEQAPGIAHLSDKGVETLVASEHRAVEKAWLLSRFALSEAKKTVRGLSGHEFSKAVAQAAVGLCRLAELPARMVSGARYVPGQDAAPGSFMPHTWVEVYTGDRWEAVDPLAEKADAVDARYIALVVHGPRGELPASTKGLSPLTLFGRAVVEVLKTEP